MWTAGALRSEARPYAGLLYRIVEGQHLIATNRLAAGLPEQARLEQLVATVKPAMPAAAARKHPLLGTPFRYGHRVASRFRRAGERPGIFYAAEAEGVVIAEASHHRLAFLSRSPGLLLPAAAIEYTVFTTNARAAAALDLTAPPLDADRARWTDPADDTACQALGTAARAAGADAIRYESVRDPARRACGGGAQSRRASRHRTAHDRDLAAAVRRHAADLAPALSRARARVVHRRAVRLPLRAVSSVVTPAPARYSQPLPAPAGDSGEGAST